MVLPEGAANPYVTSRLLQSNAGVVESTEMSGGLLNATVTPDVIAVLH
jgi:hypothetical protein